MSGESSKEEKHYMGLALQLAERGRGRTSPNPMVGAVVVKGGRVLGSGYHRRAGSDHAEVCALREAGESARGAELYVNLEPCCHWGRTPPCTETILAAGIKRVVVGMTDPNPLMAGKSVEILRERGIRVEVGVRRKECLRLNEAFVCYITSGRPFVVSKSALSLDGKVATRTGDSRWITSPAARRQVHRLRDHSDAILVGIGTVLADDPRLTVRHVEGQDPVRIILDSGLRIPERSRVLDLQSQAPTIIAHTSSVPEVKKKLLNREGVELLCLPAVADGRVDLTALLRELAEREIVSLLVEGGPSVNASFVRARLIDKFCLYIAPKIIGGESAPGPFGAEGVARVEEASEVDITDFRRLDSGELYVCAYPALREG